MKNVISSIATALLFAISLNSYSQVSITAYSDYALGVSTNKYKPISGEVKVFANNSYESLGTEIGCFYNFKAKTSHKFSVGLGINLTPFKGYDQFRALTIPVSLEIMPLKEFRCLSLLIEIAPEFIAEENAQLRYLWGFRYTFGGDNK